MLYTYKNNSFEDDFAENEQSLIRKLQQQQQEIIAPLEMDNAIYSDEEVPTRRESRSSSYSYSPIIDPMLIKQIPITHEMLPDAATYPPSSDLLSSSALKNESRNKILQSIEILNIEERFLSIFITVFSIFALFQISLLVSIKFDLLDTFDLTDNVLDSIFSYSYLAFLFIAKNISYASLIIFFLRIYSGAKFFQKFNSNLIISLLNQQFFKFLNIYMSLAVMIAFDCFLQVVDRKSVV